MANEEATEGTEGASADSGASSRMANALAKLNSDLAPEAEETPEMPPAAAAPEAKPEAKPEEPKPEKPEGAPLDKETQDRLALIARREQERDQKIATRMAELAAKEKATQEKLAKAEEWDRLKARLAEDPAAVLDFLEVKDPKVRQALAEQLWWSTIGDDAPKEHKAAAESAKLRAKIADLERKQAEFTQREATLRQETQRQQAVAGVRQNIVATLQGLPEGSSPITRAYFKARPDQTVNQILDATVRVLEERVAADPGGDPPSYQEILDLFEQELEAEIAPIRELLTPKIAAEPAGEKKPATRTLSSARAATKTQERPAALTDKERMERAKAKLEGRL